MGAHKHLRTADLPDRGARTPMPTPLTVAICEALVAERVPVPAWTTVRDVAERIQVAYATVYADGLADVPDVAEWEARLARKQAEVDMVRAVLAEARRDRCAHDDHAHPRPGGVVTAPVPVPAVPS